MVQMEQGSSSTLISKRIWHILRVFYYMVRKGLSKHKFMMDLHLIFKRGKIASKALMKLMTFHYGHHHGSHHHHASPQNIYSAFSCRSMDPNLSFYNPKEVEFSCSNTPSYTPNLFSVTKRKNHPSQRQQQRSYEEEEVATIRKAFEMLNCESFYDAESASIVATPSPALWDVGRSPAVPQLRITDSPFPLREEGGEGEVGRVDREAEEFIKRFYEQLRLQQHVPPTPEYRYLVGKA